MSRPGLPCFLPSVNSRLTNFSRAITFSVSPAACASASIRSSMAGPCLRSSPIASLYSPRLKASLPAAFSSSALLMPCSALPAAISLH